jgi:hypothetical protein
MKKILLLILLFMRIVMPETQGAFIISKGIEIGGIKAERIGNKALNIPILESGCYVCSKEEAIGPRLGFKPGHKYREGGGHYNGRRTYARGGHFFFGVFGFHQGYATGYGHRNSSVRTLFIVIGILLLIVIAIAVSNSNH